MNAQSSILLGVPRVARYLSFSSQPNANAAASLASVQALNIDEQIASAGAEAQAAVATAKPERRFGTVLLPRFNARWACGHATGSI